MSGGCPNIERCELFPLLQSGTLGYCLNAYCYSAYQGCARYQFVQLHGRRPPVTLLPNGGDQPAAPAPRPAP